MKNTGCFTFLIVIAILALFLSCTKDITPVVCDDINFSTNVKFIGELEYLSDSEYYKEGDFVHTFKFPKINIDAQGAELLNQEMYSLVENIHKGILEDNTGRYIWNISYSYKVYDNLLGILINVDGGIVEAGGFTQPYYFYYDIKTDSRISYDQYLNALGLTQEKVWEWFTSTEEYQMDYMWISRPIKGAIFDKDSTIFTCESNEYEDHMTYELSKSIFKKGE